MERWEYGYDGRDRLVLAVRYDDQGVEEYREAYAYDAGDNLVTKTVTEAGQSPATTTFTVNAANELVTQSDGVTNVTYTYDAAGRQASKYDGTYTTINSWRYADMLYKVETDEPGVPDVEYLYGGDGMRRERTTTDGAYTWYNYAGFSLQSEEDAAGALDRTHVGRLADLTGSDPATAAARYFTHDMLGSTRGVWGPAKNLLGAWEPTPYGDPYTDTLPSDILHRFTGHLLDPVTEAYYAPYRYYEPETARWMKHDPLGMVDGPNMFAYVDANSIVNTDPDGRVGVGVAIGIACAIGLGIGAYKGREAWKEASRQRGQRDRKKWEKEREDRQDARSGPKPPFTVFGPPEGVHKDSWWEGFNNPGTHNAEGSLGPGDNEREIRRMLE